jgi:hypothetical protein
MKKTIEFVNNVGKSPDPISKSREITFRDIVIKEKYKNRKAKFGTGITWLRFLPAIKPSQYDWMMPVEIYKDIKGVTFASPKSLDSNTPCCFDTARMWLQRNNKAVLKSKDRNPNGLHLYPMRHGISWVIEESAPEGERLKLFLGSLYDGSRGGTTGLAYNIRHEADTRDNEPGSPTLGELVHGDITDPKAGRLIKVERNVADKSEYASYKIGVGKNPAPVEALIDSLTDEERELVVPLEKVIYVPTEEEQHDLLRRYIGDELYFQIFPDYASSSSKSRHEEVDEVDEVNDEDEEEPAPVAVKPATKKATVATTVVEESDDSDDEDTSSAPYTTREVTALMGKGKKGVEQLLANRHRLSKQLLDIVLDTANEYGIEA